MQHIPRIYQPIPLKEQQEVILTQAATNHLVRVLRLRVGDQCFIFNGEKGEFSAQIVSIKKTEGKVLLGKFIERNVESPLKIHLGQAISRSEKMDYTIQKAVELGVAEITPLFTERCGVKLSQERWEKRLQHWRAVVMSACEQSGRTKIPIIHDPKTLAQWITQIQADLKIILEPSSQKKIHDIQIKPNSIVMMTGPEGGFSTLETAMAGENNFISLNLGPRILRTETAGLVAITVMQCFFGDF